MDIDFKQEALAFVLANGICTQFMTLQIIEAAMRKGAELLAVETTKQVHEAVLDLEIKRAQNISP